MSISLPTKSELYNNTNNINNQSDVITLNIYDKNNIALTQVNGQETGYAFKNNIYDTNDSNINKEIITNSKNQQINFIGLDNVRNEQPKLPPYGVNINQKPNENNFIGLDKVSNEQPKQPPYGANINQKPYANDNFLNSNYNKNNIVNNQFNNPVLVQKNKLDDDFVEVEINPCLRCCTICSMLLCCPCLCLGSSIENSKKNVSYCEQFGRLCCCEKILVRRGDANNSLFH